MQKWFNVGVVVVLAILLFAVVWLYLRPCECEEIVVPLAGYAPCPEPIIVLVSEPVDTPVCATDVPTEVPTVTPTDVPTSEPTEVPTSVPTADPTDEPPPYRERCNKGGGNGSEGCNPGRHPELGNDDE